jgi:threonine dehydrogenase-like Zn-dependent dehydrogenase
MPRKDDRRLRIGVLGCGPIAQFAHFEACTKARNADLYAICDVAEDLRTRMAATHAPEKTFADYDAPQACARWKPASTSSAKSLSGSPSKRSNNSAMR